MWSTDVNAALINLYLAVQQGWVPPSEVSRETYAAAKALPDTDPMKAFCGFGCSFGGKWFGGYVEPTRTLQDGGVRKMHTAAKMALIRDCSGRDFAIVNMLGVPPSSVGAVLYLDPPYAGTTTYAGAPPFDSEAFCRRCAEWALFTDVFVSEYVFPIGHLVWEGRSPVALRGKGNGGGGVVATERLYHLPKGSRW